MVNIPLKKKPPCERALAARLISFTRSVFGWGSEPIKPSPICEGIFIIRWVWICDLFPPPALSRPTTAPNPGSPPRTGFWRKGPTREEAVGDVGAEADGVAPADPEVVPGLLPRVEARPGRGDPGGGHGPQSWRLGDYCPRSKNLWFFVNLGTFVGLWEHLSR